MTKLSECHECGYELTYIGNAEYKCENPRCTELKPVIVLSEVKFDTIEAEPKEVGYRQTFSQGRTDTQIIQALRDEVKDKVEYIHKLLGEIDRLNTIESEPKDKAVVGEIRTTESEDNAEEIVYKIVEQWGNALVSPKKMANWIKEYAEQYASSKGRLTYEEVAMLIQTHDFERENNPNYSLEGFAKEYATQNNQSKTKGGWTDDDLLNAVRYGSVMIADINFKTPSEWLSQYKEEKGGKNGK